MEKMYMTMKLNHFFQLTTMAKDRRDGGIQLEKALECLKATFNHSDFKTPLQKDAVMAVAEGRHAPRGHIPGFCYTMWYQHLAGLEVSQSEAEDSLSRRHGWSHDGLHFLMSN